MLVVVESKLWPDVSSIISTLNDVAVSSLSHVQVAPLAGHIGSVARGTVTCGLRSKYTVITIPIKRTRLKIEMANSVFFCFI